MPFLIPPNIPAPRRRISNPAVGTVYAAAAPSTVYPQSSAPVLAEEQVAPEWGSRDKHGNDGGEATPVGNRGARQCEARNDYQPEEKPPQRRHQKCPLFPAGTQPGQTLRTRWQSTTNPGPELSAGRGVPCYPSVRKVDPGPLQLGGG